MAQYAQGPGFNSQHTQKTAFRSDGSTAKIFIFSKKKKQKQPVQWLML
jgi:hypothetical protein